MKIGILLGKVIQDYKIKTLELILNDSNFKIKYAFIDNKKPMNLWQKFLKNMKRGRGGYIIIMAINKLFSSKSTSVNARDFLNKNNIEFIETDNLYSNLVLDQLNFLRLDIILLISGFGILKDKIINSTKFGILSYHHGDMTKYRGMPPCFWELYYDEKEVGITVQKISTKLDAGFPIIEKKVKIDNKDSYESLLKKTKYSGIDMMYESLLIINNGNYKLNSLEKLGKIYTLPNLTQWLILKIKIFYKKLKN